MKKIILSVFSVFALSFYAQQKKESFFGFSKGDFLVGGNVKINSTNDGMNNEIMHHYEFYPMISYFVRNNFALSIEFGYFESSERKENKIVNEISGSGVSISGSYLFLDLGERFKTFTQIGFGASYGTLGIGEDKYDFSGFNAAAGLGFCYFITEKIILSMALSDILSYQSISTEKFMQSKDISTFHANINIFDNFLTKTQFGLIYKL